MDGMASGVCEDPRAAPKLMIENVALAIAMYLTAADAQAGTVECHTCAMSLVHLQKLPAFSSHFFWLSTVRRSPVSKYCDHCVINRGGLVNAAVFVLLFDIFHYAELACGSRLELTMQTVISRLMILWQGMVNYEGGQRFIQGCRCLEIQGVQGANYMVRGLHGGIHLTDFDKSSSGFIVCKLSLGRFP
jgi:hypothetical protein